MNTTLFQGLIVVPNGSYYAPRWLHQPILVDQIYETLLLPFVWMAFPAVKRAHFRRRG